VGVGRTRGSTNGEELALELGGQQHKKTVPRVLKRRKEKGFVETGKTFPCSERGGCESDKGEVDHSAQMESVFAQAHKLQWGTGFPGKYQRGLDKNNETYVLEKLAGSSTKRGPLF